MKAYFFSLSQCTTTDGYGVDSIVPVVLRDILNWMPRAQTGTGPGARTTLMPFRSDQLAHLQTKCQLSNAMD